MFDAPATPSPVPSGIAIFLSQRLKAGDVVIDVGANEGTYTRHAAELVSRTGHVHAIEPSSANCERLTQQIAGFGNVMVHRAAVSDQPGRAKLFLDCHRGTEHSLASGNVGKRGLEEDVTVVTLDDFCDRLQRCDLIKIDAQGAEVRILRGGRRLLKKFHPVIVLELWPSGLAAFGDRPSDVFDALESLDYELTRLGAKGGLKPRSAIDEFLQEQGRWRSINVAAIPRNRPLSDRLDRSS